MVKKLTTEYVGGQFASAGYEMLGAYENCTTPIPFVCGKGHRHQMRWTDFQNGKRCAICAGKHVNPEYVKAQFALVGYEMLGAYENCTTLIPFVCDKGHRHQMSWNSFRNGGRCGVCAGRYVNPEYVKAQFALAGYEILGAYVHKEACIPFICDKGHRHQMSWNSFRNGGRCGVCHSEKFYQNYSDYGVSKILGSINTSLKKSGSDLKWDYYYDRDFLGRIAEPIQQIYRTCPKGFAVDHIVPVSWFSLWKEDSLLACWSPNNLRRLDAIENIRKHNRMSRELWEEMKQKHPEITDQISVKPKICDKHGN